MKQILHSVAIAGALALSACHSGDNGDTTGSVADASEPYVTVNDYPVPQFVANTAIAEQQSRGGTDSPEFNKALREEMIRRGALLSEAKKLGLDKRPEHRQQVELATQMLLMRDVVADYLKQNPVTDDDLQIAYNAVIEQVGNSEYKLRHIQLETDEEAQNIIARLGSEEDISFARLAKESSLDAATKDNGGSLGWNAPPNLPAPVRDVVKVLAKGRYTTTPVQTSAGYHVILVEDIRPFTPPTLEALRPRLLESVAQMKATRFVEELKENAVVVPPVVPEEITAVVTPEKS
jgi:peptidyl-prolyl cis-trans isomerase C